jgi:hypothetical protein
MFISTFTAAKKSYFAWNITMRDVLVKERLGVGDTGTSNRGFYKDQAVVIKKLRSPPLTEPWLDTVREEVKKLSMLMHPNLSLFLGIAIKCVLHFVFFFFLFVSSVTSV